MIVDTRTLLIHHTNLSTCMYLESLPVDADRGAVQGAHVLILIQGRVRRGHRPSTSPVHLLKALPCIDCHCDEFVQSLIFYWAWSPLPMLTCPGPRWLQMSPREKQTLPVQLQQRASLVHYMLYAAYRVVRSHWQEVLKSVGLLCKALRRQGCRALKHCFALSGGMVKSRFHRAAAQSPSPQPQRHRLRQSLSDAAQRPRRPACNPAAAQPQPRRAGTVQLKRQAVP